MLKNLGGFHPSNYMAKGFKGGAYMTKALDFVLTHPITNAVLEMTKLDKVPITKPIQKTASDLLKLTGGVLEKASDRIERM